MHKYAKMQNFIIFFFCTFTLNFCHAQNDISDLRRCGDPTCSEPVSLAKSLITYPSGNENILSFKANSEVKIFSKSAGSRMDLWGAEINGKRGYVPYKLLREYKILKKNLDHLVPTEIHNSNQPQPTVPTYGEATIPLENNNILSNANVKNSNEILVDVLKPDKVAAAHEIVDGTTIYYPNDELGIIVTQKDSEISILKHGFEPNRNDKSDESSDSFNAVLDETTIRSNNFDTGTPQLKDPISTLSEFSTDADKNKPDENISNDDLQITSESDPEDDFDDSVYDDDDDDYKSTEINLNGDQVNQSEEVGEKVDEKIVQDTEAGLLHSVTNLINITQPKSVENIETPPHANENIIDDLKQGKLSTQQSSDLNIQEESNPSPDIIPEARIEMQTNLNDHLEVVVTDNTPIPPNNANDNIGDVTVNKLEILHESIDSKISDSISDNAAGNILLPTNSNSDEKFERVTQVDELINHEIADTNINDPITHASADFTQLPQMGFNSDENFEGKATMNIREIPLESSDANIYIPKEEKNVIDVPHIESPNTDFSSLNIDGDVASTTSDGMDVNVEDLDPAPQFTTNIPTTINPLDEITVTDLSATEYLDTSIDSESVKDINENNSFVPVESESPGDSPEANDSVPEAEVDLNKNDIVDDAQIFEVEGYFQRFSSMFSSFLSKQDDKIETTVSESYESSQNPPTVYHEDTSACQKDQEFDSACSVEQHKSELRETDTSDNTYDVIIYLSITSISVLVFTLGYYYIEKLRQDAKLIGHINELEKAILIAGKENAIVKDELQVAKDKLASFEDSSFDSKGTVLKLESELDEVNTVRAELEEKLAVCEKELETATEAGFELNKMLADFINSQSGNDSLVESLELLQKQLNEQQHTIAEMTVAGNAKTRELNELEIQLIETNEKNNSLQTELNKVVANLVKIQEEKSHHIDELNKRISELEIEIEDHVIRTKSYEKQMEERVRNITDQMEHVQHLSNIKENELIILKESIEKLNTKGDADGNDLDIIELSHVRAELKEANSDRDRLASKLHIETTAKRDAEQKIQQLFEDLNMAKCNLEEASKGKIESQTRLEVLSTYFKEKEAQLLEELSKHQQLWLQNKGEANSTIERIKCLQEEVQNYKLQNEMLKNEILDQEVSLKSQISVMEKKNHESWLQARQIERRLEESKQEACQLRNRLTFVEKNLSNPEEKIHYRVLSPLNTNGDLATSPIHLGEPPASPSLIFPHHDQMPTSPPFMGLPPPPPPGVPFMPPPPGAPFMPPPPPTLFPGDRRPPPLGRMSSPPPPNTFSPTRTYSPYERDASPPLSPRSRSYRMMEPPYRDMDSYRHRSPPPTFEIPPRPNWDDRHNTIRFLDQRSSRLPDQPNEHV